MLLCIRQERQLWEEIDLRLHYQDIRHTIKTFNIESTYLFFYYGLARFQNVTTKKQCSLKLKMYDISYAHL